MARRYGTNPTKVRGRKPQYGTARLTRWAGKRGSRYQRSLTRWALKATRYGRIKLGE